MAASLSRWVAARIATVVILSTFVISQTPCSERTLIVSVLDEHGNSVPGLTRKNLSVKVGGQPAAVVSAQSAQALPRIVIVLDASASMLEPAEKWELARRFSADVVTRSRPEAPIGLIVFASKFHKVVPVSSNHQPVLDTIREMSALQNRQTGTTPLTNTLFEAIGMLMPAQPGDVVYLVSDGEDNQSKQSVADIQKAFLTRGIRLYGALLWSHHPASINAEDFQNVAKNTGGFVVNETPLPFQDGPFSWQDKYDVTPAHRALLAAAADQLYEEVFQAYRITVQTPAFTKPERLKIEVVDPSGARRKGVTLSYPAEMIGCTLESK